MRQAIWCICCFVILSVSCTQPTQDAATASPTATTGIVWPENATVFSVDRSESRAQYFVVETFLKDSAVILIENPVQGTFETVGSTRAVAGTLALDLNGALPMVLGGEFAVDLRQLRTGKGARDEILGTRWLQSVVFPTATFVVEPQTILSEPYRDGEEVAFELAGVLTIREVAKPVVFDIRATLQDDPFACSERIAECKVIVAEGSAELKLTDFNIDPPNLANIVTVEDSFRIGIDLRAAQTD